MPSQITIHTRKKRQTFSSDDTEEYYIYRGGLRVFLTVDQVRVGDLATRKVKDITELYPIIRIEHA